MPSPLPVEPPRAASTSNSYRTGFDLFRAGKSTELRVRNKRHNAMIENDSKMSVSSTETSRFEVHKCFFMLNCAFFLSCKMCQKFMNIWYHLIAWQTHAARLSCLRFFHAFNSVWFKHFKHLNGSVATASVLPSTKENKIDRTIWVQCGTIISTI